MPRVFDVISHAQKPLWFVTANPEILLEARRNPLYHQALLQADARLVDGFGLWCALRLQGECPSRLTGVDLAEEMIRFSIQKQWKMVLLGGASTHAAGEAMRKRYPDARIDAEEAGTIGVDGTTDERTDEAMSRITLLAPDVLLIGFGHPKQEQWIARHLHEFPSVKVVIGVGGTFDVWSGRIQRAPQWMRTLGLEWSWRVIREPSRIGRIFHAIIVFPWVWMLDKIRK